jgi:hypothetical protein
VSPRTWNYDPDLFHAFTEYLLTSARWKTTRSAATRHAGQADYLTRYLFYVQRAPISSITEFDLRSFLYGTAPGRLQERKDEAARMLGSLRRFFDFLADERGILCPWAAELLEDRESLDLRTRSLGPNCADELAPEWIMPLYRDLEQRLLIPSPTTPSADLSEKFGPRRFVLGCELQRLWLAWRDELIGDGYNRRRDLQKALIARQLIWEYGAHPKLGRTPAELVESEPDGTEDEDGKWDPFGHGASVTPPSIQVASGVLRANGL